MGVANVERIWAYRHALWGMAVKQLRAKYVGSILGIFWAVINPLLTMAVLAFVFTKVFNSGIKNFHLFALAGILPWMFFSSALLEAVFSLFNQRGILHQFNLPREIIPLSTILSAFLNFLIGWVIIYPVFLLCNFKIAGSLPLLMVLLVLQLFFVSGLGLALSAINIFVQDLGHVLGVVLMLWFWITPVFYSVDMVPASFQWVVQCNPMAAFILAYRQVLLSPQIPSIGLWVTVLCLALGSSLGGLAVFSLLESKLLKRI